MAARDLIRMLYMAIRPKSARNLMHHSCVPAHWTASAHAMSLTSCAGWGRFVMLHVLNPEPWSGSSNTYCGVCMFDSL